MKIRTVIFGVYVAASALGFAVLMTFILKEVRPRYVESMRRTLADTAALLAVMLEADLERRPQTDLDLGAAWRGNLGALERASGALRVYVTDTHGIVTFDSAGGADVGRDYTRRPEMAVYFSELQGPGNADLVGGELRVTAEVRREGEVVGVVGVARPLSSVTEAILRARLRLVAGSLAVATMMVAAGWWIAAKLTGSLERLTAYVEAVRDGRAARPPESRASEIATLVKAFEEMRVALEGKAYVERYTQALAHEVKAPLSAIRGAAELLQEELPAEERARFLENVRTESARMQMIVERMLRLAALEARRGLEGVENVEVADVVKEAIEALRPASGRRGLTVCVENEAIATRLGNAEKHVCVRGERFLLVQAVVNLVQNAIEFSPENGVIAVRIECDVRREPTRDRLEARSDEAWVRVVVEDDGPGVPAFAQDRIFERFYSLARPGGGRKSTGLGLSFVREIAALHGGRVEVVNRDGGGTRAVLTLAAAA